MTLLELYEKLCTDPISLDNEGLCSAICEHVSERYMKDFSIIMSERTAYGGSLWGDGYTYLPHTGVMTPERETFLLLFAAYKGEL